MWKRQAATTPIPSAAAGASIPAMWGRAQNRLFCLWLCVPAESPLSRTESALGCGLVQLVSRLW
jgi:hypothetical protein